MKKKTLLGIILVTIICLFPFNDVHAFEWPTDYANIQCKFCGSGSTKFVNSTEWVDWETTFCRCSDKTGTDMVVFKCYVSRLYCTSCKNDFNFTIIERYSDYKFRHVSDDEYKY